jgi:hypothetical protein
MFFAFARSITLISFVSCPIAETRICSITVFARRTNFPDSLVITASFPGNAKTVAPSKGNFVSPLNTMPMSLFSFHIG